MKEAAGKLGRGWMEAWQTQWEAEGQLVLEAAGKLLRRLLPSKKSEHLYVLPLQLPLLLLLLLLWLHHRQRQHTATATAALQIQGAPLQEHPAPGHVRIVHANNLIVCDCCTHSNCRHGQEYKN